VLNSIKSHGGKGDTVISQRYYVADADYLVGLESEDQALLESLEAALESPVWQLYFGRKSFVPSCPVLVKRVDEPLWVALKHPITRKKTGKLPDRLRCVVEVPDSLDVRQDVPLDWQKRLFGSRCVNTDFLDRNLCISQD
jgi:CRISPR system Cascade subunit CasD